MSSVGGTGKTVESCKKNEAQLLSHIQKSTDIIYLSFSGWLA